MSAPPQRYPLICVYAVRSEPDWLVADMRENLAWVDQFVEQDNRQQRGKWFHEGTMRRAQRELIATATAGQPAWVLQMDPDERLEWTGCNVVPATLRRLEREAADLANVTVSFPLREMWTPAAYRIDSGWAAKKPRVRLFWFDPHGRQRFRDERPIHVGLMPLAATNRVRLDDVRLYHLKNIEPMNRVRRAAAYLAADPEFQWQRREGRDWTWLYDETDLELEPLGDRLFTPPYIHPYDYTMPE